MRRLPFMAAVCFFAFSVACGNTEEPLPSDYVPDGSDDSWAGGLPDPGDQVWQVSHAWTDSAPNGESYEEYYATWLATIASESDSFGSGVDYTLADGTVIPAPSIECADTALSLRFIFAQQHGLPMFVRAGSYYFGHFGWTDLAGNRQRSYARYDMDAPRGSDSALAASARYLPDDEQDWPEDGATIGAYMDAAYRNKRFGYFMQDLWNMVYSGNLAENSNTFYILPEHIRGGDLQLHRSDNTGGIGHTITIQRVERSTTGRLLAVDVIQSYMPTHPWISNGYSELINYRPNPVTGSGLRRWRRPVLSNGKWYLVADSSVAAEASEVSQNCERFEELFNMSSDDEVAAMLETIETRRAALTGNPNSCRRREEREDAFDGLYELFATTPELYNELGFDAAPSIEDVKADVDRRYRTIDDFIWSEMYYERSWVCHWNPSDPDVNADMYRATVAYNRQLLAEGGCEALRIFRSENVSEYDGSDGFDDIANYARSNDYSWDDYALDPGEGDEGGALRDVENDMLAEPDMIDYFCTLYESLDFWAQP